MKRLLGAAALAAIAIAAGTAVAEVNADEPFWAWGFNGPPPATPVAAAPGAPRDNVVKHTLPGSTLARTQVEAGDGNNPPDWYPEDHPQPMPDIVAHGRAAANITACGLCHLPTGFGRPENANVAGYTKEYFLQQLQDFKNGKRVTTDTRKTNTATMTSFAKNMTDAEMQAAADYFSKVPMRPWVKVVESTTAPKAHSAGGMWIAEEGALAGTEPLGQRIIEVPLDADGQEKWRDPRDSFIAYVPVGSVKKGEAIVTTGGGKVTACIACHGPDLHGLGPVPTIAGRSPTYLARQLYDMQHGNRTGAWTPLMVPVVSKLTAEDIVNVTAYLASLPL